jgi:hypothetical protein
MIIVFFYLIRYMQHLACRFHPHAVLIEDSRAGDMICPMCGLVVGERYNYLNEKNFSDKIFFLE